MSTNTTDNVKKVTTATIRKMKAEGEKVAMITAYEEERKPEPKKPEPKKPEEKKPEPKKPEQPAEPKFIKTEVQKLEGPKI
ncbi:MAG: hypothetical protein II671_05215, partial [Salinivirgaceae bacterium]|nr:hypothetical protein [Salinivirgaceae bacterium]